MQKYVVSLLTAVFFLWPAEGDAQEGCTTYPEVSRYTLAGASVLSAGMGLLATSLIHTQWAPVSGTASVDEFGGITMRGEIEVDNPPELWVMYGVAVTTIVTGVILFVVDAVLRMRSNRASIALAYGGLRL